MKHTLLCLLLLAFLASAERKPDNIPTSIWVREDIFAGLLASDMKRFAVGEQKLADLLAENPNQPEPTAWKASTQIFRGVLAFEAGSRPEFDKLYQTGTATLEALHKQAPGHVGVLAIYGGTLATLGHRLPPDIQTAAARRSSEMYLRLEQVQKEGFDKMPVHHRGEVLAGVAQGAARSAQDELSRTYLKRIVATLPDTPYAPIAQKMLDQPGLAKTARLSCNTCHEPNRLANYKPAK